MRILQLFSVLIVLGLTISASLAAAQTALPSFDAATIKPNLSGVGGNRVNISPEMLDMNNVTLNICLKFAYNLNDNQISGPDAINTERYDIVARAASPVSDSNQMRLMMQSLLAERFHLTIHKESRMQTAFALVVAKNGPKFQKSVGEGRPMLNGKGTVVGQFVPIKALADFLTGPMHASVIDMTGLEGQYDFKFDLMAYMPTDLPPGKEPDVAVMVLNGIEEQLGLKLESRKLPVDVLVIDHVEKPSAN